LDALLAGVEEDAGIAPSSTADNGSSSSSDSRLHGNKAPDRAGRYIGGAAGAAAEAEVEADPVLTDLDPLLFYDEYHYSRNGSYRTIMGAISTVADVVASDDITTYDRLYRPPRDAAEGSSAANPYRISLADWAVSFNACIATISSITNLERMYEHGMPESSSCRRETHARSMILSELRRVGALYDEVRA